MPAILFLLFALFVWFFLPLFAFLWNGFLDLIQLPMFWVLFHISLLIIISRKISRGNAMSEQTMKVLLLQMDKMVQSLNRIEQYLTPRGVADSIEFYTIINGQEVKVEGPMVLKQGEKAILKLKIVDAGKNPAKVQDDKVEWSMSDASLGDLKVADDTMSAEFIPNGKVGSLKIQATGDADLGEGVKPIVGEIDLEQLAGEAVAFELSVEAAPL